MATTKEYKDFVLEQLSLLEHYNCEQIGQFKFVTGITPIYQINYKRKKFAFFTSGDLLDSPKWDQRKKEGDIKGTQHDSGHFDIALELANYITG